MRRRFGGAGDGLTHGTGTALLNWLAGRTLRCDQGTTRMFTTMATDEILFARTGNPYLPLRNERTPLMWNLIRSAFGTPGFTTICVEPTWKNQHFAFSSWITPNLGAGS